jgi:hypothetical protein
MAGDMTGRTLIFAALLALLLPAAQAASQAPVLPQDTMPPADTIPDEAPLPRAAFIRAMVLPGWGHYHLGEYGRGAVYMAIQVTSWAMLAKSIQRLDTARDGEAGLTALGRDSALMDLAVALHRATYEADSADARRLATIAGFDAAVAQYPGVQGARGLATSRQRHRQDWIVYTTVFTFAAAIDAYVTAHLKEFPSGITALPAADGGVRLSVRLPLGTRR